jgi:hypothetical protein
MMRWITGAILLSLAALTGLPAEAGIPGVGVEGQARNVLRRHCWRCHSGSGSQGGDINVLSATQLRDKGLVVPGDPAESELLTRIEHEQMPPIAVRRQQPVTAREAEILRQWITAGAGDFPRAEDRERISLWTVMERARASA